MIPEIDVQLATIAKALADNVLPAVDGANRMALEQLQLCLGTLAVIRQRLPDLHRYLRRDLQDNLELARTLVRLGGGTEAVATDITASERMLADPEMGPAEIERQVRVLKERIAQLIDKARGTPAERDIATAVIAAQEPMILRARAWAIAMGFEPDVSQIPNLNELLDRKNDA